MKLVTAPIKALYDPVGAFKDVFGGVQGIFAGLTGAAKTSGASSSEPSSQTVRSSKAPVRFILGRASTGGVLAWVQEEPGDQTGGEWLHIVYVLSEGAIAGVDEIYVDERRLSDLGENATSEVIINPAQVNAFLLSKCPDWRQEQIGRGLSFVRLSFKYDAEKFPSGIPDVRFVVRGRSDVYDPRNGAVGYSANTALLILWYLRNRCAIPDDEIIFDSFASSANVCDEPVFGPDGKISPRYFAGAVIGADEKRNTVLDNLLSACAGTLIRVGGRWSLQVGAYYGPADFTVNEDMVIGTVEGTTEVSNSDAINTMRGTFVDPAQAWAETDYPEVAIQDWITKDGGELAESQSFAYVTDAYLAQRLANISLRRRRSGGSLSVPLNFNGYNCRPGRAVKVDLPSLNILGEFMVTEWTMGAADACKVTLKPYEQAIFDDAVGQPYDPLGFINLPVGGLAAVTGLAWAPSGVAEVIQGVLSWTPPLQTVLSYTVTIRKGTEVVQSLKAGGEAASCNINGLTSGVYTMSVIAFGPGTRSGEATINVNVGGPPVPESCAFYASVDTITLVPANRQSSLNGGTYEYFYTTNPSAPIADAVYLGQGLTFTHTGLAFAKEYFYYVRSANAYGKSDFLFVPAATSSDPTQMLEVIAGRITESELGKELTSRIDLIDMNGPGSVNERVGEVRNQLNEQVAEVNTAIETVKSSVVTARDELQQQLAAVDQEVDAALSELQQQINTVSALAGSLPYNKDKTYTLNQGVLGADGKLYQALKAVPKNNPPPNATYWTDVGQAIVTAAGTATRVGKVETDVATLNGTSTAQASKIEGLQSGLSTTNGNVTAAQQAAQAAATAAGAKGEVIYGTTAPAADKRLAQNLWIDTTGNANTPKRWNGSTWVAVTDKVATDAAAAAANALAVAQTKADAQAVQSVTTRVTDVEGAVSAQGQAMTGLQSSLTTTKQDVTAAQQAAQAAATAAGAKGEVIYGATVPAADKRLTQNLWIDTTGNANTPKRWNGSAWVAVSDKVATDAAAAAAAANALAATKADASAVNLLTNRVSNAEGVLTSYSSDITQLKNSLIAAQSFVAGKAWEFTGSTRGWFGTLSGSTFVAGPLFATSGNCPNLQCNFTPTFPGAENPFLRIRLRRRNTARAGAQMYWANEDGGLAEARRMPWTINTTTTDWQDIEIDLSSHAGWSGKNILAIRLDMMSASDTTGEIDIAYIAVGRRSIAASAEAVSNLSSAVSDADGKLTTQGQSIIGLQNGLTTTNQGVTAAQQAAQAAATAAGAKGEVIYGSSAPAADKRLAQNLWIDTAGNANTPKRWSGSAWVAVSDKVATDAAAAAQSALTEVAKKADASTVQNLSNTVAQHGQDITAQGQAMTAIDAAIAEVGGENLLYNPTFNRASEADANVPDGWFLEGAATKNPSMVSSWLNSGEQAFRVAVTGVTSSSPYLSLVTHASQRPKIAGGQTVTSSVYARRMAESGLLSLRLIHQWYNEAGAVISAPANGFVPITVEGGRITFTSVAPAGAVRVNVYFRIHGQTAAAANGSVELARPQAEYGSRATGWRDNGQVTAGEVAANVSATNLLSGRVSQTEQGLVSQGQSIVSLEGGLTTTKQNVTAAQQAAQAAATAAGAKGEVIYGSTAPAADKRLAQNLWIDTAGNANTPKRWNGSTWVAVSDKVATDAAAAAANALSVAQTKADAQTVSALTNEVSRQGGDISANGSAIVDINTSIAQIGGENLLYNPSFDKGTASLAERWRVGNGGSTYTATLVPSTLDPQGKAQRFDVSGLVAGSGSVFLDFAPGIGDRPATGSGQILTASAFVRGTPGLQVQVYTQFKNAAGNTIATTGPIETILADAWQRVVLTSASAPVGTVAVDVLYRVRSAPGSALTGGFVEWDRAQLEQGARVSGWRDNGRVNAAEISGNASATTALSGRMSAVEEGLTSASSQLTQLDNAIGDAGGENLLYNPTFNQVNAADATVPDGWMREGAAQNNSSMVESWLNAGERAFRSAVTGVTNGSPYLSLVPAVAKRVKVGGSQTITSSIYARRAATSGLLSIRLYIQCLNASGGIASTVSSGLQAISVEGGRVTVTATTPADAVLVVVYYRIHGATSAAANGTFELARPQVEYGSRASGWRDSGQVNAANNAATSTAVENLTSTVSQQGSSLGSVAGRTTSLENSLTTTNQNVTTAQQAAQAAATAAGVKGEVIYGSTAPAADKRLAQNLWIDTTGNANTPKRWSGSTWVAVSDKVATDAAAAAASALTQVATKADASAVNSLTNRVNSAEGTLTSNSSDITQLKNSIGTAQPFVAGKAWEFIGSTQGWVGTIAGSTFTAGPLFATASKCPNLQCNFTPAIAGAENPFLRIRLRRRNTTRAGAQMYWANEDGGLAEARRMAWTINLTTNDWQDIEFDLSGHAGWNGKNIIAIRLDMMNSVDSSGEIDIAYIAVGRRSAAASAQAVASLESTVTQQGGKLTAEGQRIDGLYTAVGDANAAIQNEAKARVDGDGALSKQLQTTQASLGTTNAAVQQVATAQANMKGMLNAQYTLRVQVNNQYGVHHFAGFGIGINEQNGVVQSAFAVYSDQFILLNANGGGLSSPFSVVGGQTFIADAYIRSASIGNAKIADGAITAAKIGVAEIDTLRIRGNAVTVPVSANSPGNVLGVGVGQWQNLIAIGVQMDEGGFITAQYSCYQGFGSGIRKYMFQMDINGHVIAQGGGDWADGFPNLMGSIGVGPGYFVITVKWWGENSGVGVQNHTLYAMGTKR
ncbi:phage tail protein [Pseudomonas sp. NBRC 111141]|uniref:phage tail protein n=1 Tax=Pseudomonas sp. NBRC 111141 TaxID=1661056 RepID=UPI0008635B41|nr:phage tail protein [Pseudomonas sp. NBRC 111141]